MLCTRSWGTGQELAGHRCAARIKKLGNSIVVGATTRQQERRILRYKDEFNFSLSEYMVVLDKPLGLTLSPDPVSGQIIVQSIKDGSPAALCQLIQVGDIVRKCSAVFGEDMWTAIDIRRMRWAINNRTSKVKLVLERVERPMLSLPVWYTRGKSGRSSVERETLQLPVSFLTAASQDDWSQDIVSPGRPLSVGFHRSTNNPSQTQLRSNSVAARQTRLQILRNDLSRANSQPPLDLSSEVLRLAERPSQTGNVTGNGSSNNGKGSLGGDRSSTSKKRILPFLPWLLVTSTRLDTRDLTVLATMRGIGAMLELSLTTTAEGGFLAVKGADGLQMDEVNVSSLMGDLDTSEAGAEGDMDTSSQTPANGTVATSGRRVVPSTLVGRKAELTMLVHAAACLQRLTYRRLFLYAHHSANDRCAVLLHCEDGMDSKLGNLLAGWMHWFRGMPLQEAILSVELATGTVVEQSLLEEATDHLVHSANQRMSQVVLSWRHGAMSVSVAGDIVGGWNNRVALMRCTNPSGCKGSTARGHFFLSLTGLKPGTYNYKFIVDGTWTVDPSAPKVIDASGNYNNVMQVHEQPLSITSKEQLQLARWQALNLAFESKMRRMH